MSYESHAEPIKVGYLFDFKLPDSFPDEMRKDLTRPFDLVFKEGLEQGIIDRPVEIIYREVEGLPKGTIKAVIDAYGELVDEGCLAVFGPAITDNLVRDRDAVVPGGEHHVLHRAARVERSVTSFFHRPSGMG